MDAITDHSLADMLLQLSWNSSLSRHTDCLMAPGINLWRDVLPESLSRKVHGRQAGETVGLSILVFLATVVLSRNAPISSVS